MGGLTDSVIGLLSERAVWLETGRRQYRHASQDIRRIPIPTAFRSECLPARYVVAPEKG